MRVTDMARWLLLVGVGHSAQVRITETLRVSSDDAPRITLESQPSVSMLSRSMRETLSSADSASAVVILTTGPSSEIAALSKPPSWCVPPGSCAVPTASLAAAW